MRIVGVILGVLMIVFAEPAAADKGDWSFIASAQWLDQTGDTTFRDGLDLDFEGGAGLALGLNYFMTDKVSLEMKGSVVRTKAVAVTRISDAIATFSLGNLDTFPLTAVLQYHFSEGKDVDWYVGAGVSYIVFDEFESGTLLAGTSLEDDNGLVLNGGFDYNFESQWSLNLDAKYVPLETGSVFSDKDEDFTLEPYILSAGVRYRF